MRLILLAVLLSVVARAQDHAQPAPAVKPNTIPTALKDDLPGAIPNNIPNDNPNFDPNSDPSDLPLGDVARSLRKKGPLSQAVVDDDNLSAVMRQAESRHAAGSSLRFLMAGREKGFAVGAPDATCSLAFTANTKALLSNQYAQMELPPDQMLKLEGPATIEGDALIVVLYNRTDWHVSEVSVALTILKKSEVEPQSGKDPDVTMIYRMRAAAPPSATTVFSAPLKVGVAPDEEWHWALVQARGYPPQNYAGNTQMVPQNGNPAPIQSLLNPALSPTLTPTPATPQNSTAISLSQSPQ
jgi:hypothetical protein